MTMKYIKRFDELNEGLKRSPEWKEFKERKNIITVGKETKLNNHIYSLLPDNEYYVTMEVKTNMNHVFTGVDTYIEGVFLRSNSNDPNHKYEIDKAKLLISQEEYKKLKDLSDAYTIEEIS